MRYMREEYEQTDLDPALRAGVDRTNAEVLFPRLSGRTR